MPKHTIFNKRVGKEPAPSVHPIWRGIGCILMVVIPGLSYLMSNILITNRATMTWFDIPQELIVPMFKDPLLLVKIFYTAVISILVFFIIALVTFTIDRIVNPKKKGPFDVD